MDDARLSSTALATDILEVLRALLLESGASARCLFSVHATSVWEAQGPSSACIVGPVSADACFCGAPALVCIADAIDR